ncbi:HD-GYP domain-containing protein [Geomonas sp. RF6]|uniref:HD-GYP domain-containing protein n=1 Tax=Geomonas sp. RF6 TaxID=2897342 RepID=UPI001E534AD4|nr:HD-GYP domain-containing protein [Geomonas sp. RF6]UFS72239.1 HD-GYP domain-containing protein [Geomonas sp. RF6]
MNNATVQQAQRLATLLAAGLKGGGFYPPGHPAAMQPVRELAALTEQLVPEGEELCLTLGEGIFTVGDHVFFASTPALEELWRRLSDRGVRVVTMSRGASADDFLVFCRLVARCDGGIAELTRKLEEEGVATLAVSDEEEQDDPRQTYSEALEAIRDIFHEIDNASTPSARRIMKAVSSLAAVAVKDPATLMGLAMIKEYDSYTFTHSVNVGVLAMALAAAMGYSRREIEETGMAGFLHDVGKTAIDKEILNKPGRLSATEMAEMRRHPELGAEIVRQMEGVPTEVAEVVLGHHIRYDRNGYPEWARERSFGLASSIVAVADCYDASTTLRVYQRPLHPKEAVENMRRLCGTVLHETVVERFEELAGKYPVGSLVRLDSNEIAVVYLPSSDELGAVMVKVIRDAAGKNLEEPVMRRLSESGERIVDLVDPLVRGVDVARFF